MEGEGCEEWHPEERLVIIRDAQGRVERICVHQGHRDEMADQIDETELYTVVTEDDTDLKDEMMHGTFQRHVYGISRDGLGGKRGQKFRKHIHIVNRPMTVATSPACVPMLTSLSSST